MDMSQNEHNAALERSKASQRRRRMYNSSLQKVFISSGGSL